VLPGVFSPSYYSETAFFAQGVIDQIQSGDRYLDLGCGIGVTAVLAALKGALVTAFDINPWAVENTQMNAALHGVASHVDARLSDVFSSLESGEAFDVIFWNVPFAYRHPGTALDTLEESVFDPGYGKHRRYITGASRHLNKNGRILIGVSPTLSDMPTIYALACESGLTLRSLGTALEEDTAPDTWLQLLLAKPSDTIPSVDDAAGRS
jgi:16S rRNA G1207 methylase RsmC